MGRHLVREVLYKASVLLGDTEPQFIKWSEHELVLWLNDGQRCLVKYLPAAGERIDTLKLVPGTRQSIRAIPAIRVKTGDGSTPDLIQGISLDDVVRNMGVDGLIAGPVVRRVEKRNLDAINPNWHTTPGDGTVEQFVVDPRMPTEFYVQPGIPATPDCWVEITYQAAPPEIPNTGVPGNELYAYAGNSDEVIAIDDWYADDLLAYIMGRAWLKDPARAANGSDYLHQFLSSINAQAKTMTGVNPNLRALPTSYAPPPAPREPDHGNA